MAKSKEFYTNLAMAIESYYADEVTVRHFPVVGYIEPTTVCNLRCPSCPTGLNASVRERSLLSYNRFCSLIDEWGPYLFSLYMYNWGEPFLNKKFIEMVKYASKCDIDVHTSSNLNVDLRRGDALRIVESGLSSLKVGIDGITQATYEKYRRRGLLDKVVANVRMISEAKKALGMLTPVLKTFFHVFEHNEHELPYVIEFLRDIGIENAGFSSAFLPPSDEYGIKGPQKYKQFNVEVDYKKRIPKNSDTLKCSWLWFSMVYNPNGSISPCCGVTYEIDDFALVENEGGILGAFNSPRYVYARALRNRDPQVKYNSGMGLTETEGRNKQVICERCPIPFVLNNFNPETLLSLLEQKYGTDGINHD